MSSDDVVNIYCRAFEIKNVLTQDWFKALVMSADRISRISKQKTVETHCHASSNPSLFIEPEETLLCDKYNEIVWTLHRNVHMNGNDALLTLSRLTDSINVFFEKILVMHEDPKVKENRLALLKSIDNLYKQFADFGKIVM